MRSWPTLCGKSPVALLAEGVDRNRLVMMTVPLVKVALLAEGVDRNFAVGDELAQLVRSPSSRRAWIEIGLDLQQRQRRERRPPRGGRG